MPSRPSASAFNAADAPAQTYPNRPIKLIVPFPAGGPPDTIARLVANDISARLGQTVVVDNRAGGGATVGTRAAALSAPDGYTLLYGSTTSLSIGPAVFKNLDYDPVKSFAPVASVSVGSMVVAINAAVPAKDVQGARRLRQGQSGQAAQRRRRRLAAPHRLGIVHAHHRHRHRLRPL